MILTWGKEGVILRYVSAVAAMANRLPLSWNAFYTGIPLINSKIGILATTGPLAISGI
jgi:hypothetical protein